MSPHSNHDQLAAETAKHRAQAALFRGLDISTHDMCTLAVLLAPGYVDVSTDQALEMLFGLINDDQADGARTFAIDALTSQALYGPVGSDAQQRAARLVDPDITTG